jgi:tetratricopeptide (TPR) repeat protein
MPELPFDSPQPVLRGETVVFAGKLWSLGRKDRRALVEQLGGTFDEDVTLRTTILVVGAATYPNGIPDEQSLRADSSVHGQKLRRAWARLRDASAEQAVDATASIRIISEDEFCRLVGLPPIDDLRRQHYGQRDILAMYPDLREDHLRYLRKWGLLEPAFRNPVETWFTFSDLTLLRHVQAELQQGVSFRSILRDLQASRSGQLAFDFRIEAQPARILALTPRALGAEHGRGGAATAGVRPPVDLSSGPAHPLTEAEQFFLHGSALDDGSPERQEEAAQAYRDALEREPDLVAAIINLANIRYARDELAEAQALYERAIGLDQGYFEAYFNLGNIHHDHGAYQDAEMCYRHAVALNPSYADAHFYLAVTLEKMGRSNDAQSHWRAYQQLAPEGEWVELAKEFSD